jgi:hypothetical protein
MMTYVPLVTIGVISYTSNVSCFMFQGCHPSICIRYLIMKYMFVAGEKQGAVEFLKLIFRALCLCWDRQTQDLHIDWVLFRGRPLVPALCEVINDNIDGVYPSSHFPMFAEFLLPRSVRLVEAT